MNEKFIRRWYIDEHLISISDLTPEEITNMYTNSSGCDIYFIDLVNTERVVIKKVMTDKCSVNYLETNDKISEINANTFELMKEVSDRGLHQVHFVLVERGFTLMMNLHNDDMLISKKFENEDEMNNFITPDWFGPEVCDYDGYNMGITIIRSEK